MDRGEREGGKWSGMEKVTKRKPGEMPGEMEGESTRGREKERTREKKGVGA